jgi:hypothetical protein
MERNRNLGMLLQKKGKGKKGGFIGPLIGLLAPVLGKVIGSMIPGKKGSGIKGYGSGIKIMGEGHKKTKGTKGKGIMDVMGKLASGPLAGMAKDAVKKKIMEMAVSKSIDMASKKFSKKGSGVGSKSKSKSRMIKNSVGAPSYNKSAVVTVSKPMAIKTNAIKPARKKDFFI